MESSSPYALAKALLPHSPALVKSALSHTFSLSPTASKWDFKQAMTVAIVRAFILNPTPSPLSKVQRFSLRDPGIKGRMWISKVTLPKPEERDALDVIEKAIEEAKDTGSKPTYTVPEITDVEAEWAGYRAGVGDNEPRPEQSEEEHYKSMMKEVKNDATVLYFHGGAYYLMDPASHRVPTSQLAKQFGGRCFSVRYRLAPQNPFPAALLDAFVAYLSLLSPPPNSFHEPVPASKIVFAGDSAGGNLCLALLQLLLSLKRQNITSVRFHNKDVEIPLPAGLALNSPWTDLSRSMPSLQKNHVYDYLPLPSDSALIEIPRDEIWPTKPPRGDFYTELSMLCHPLVSPLACTPDQWRGAPPILAIAGEEMLNDEIQHTVSAIHRAGVKTVYDGYEAMPHVFAMMFAGSRISKKCFQRWGEFVKQAASNGGDEVRSRATWTKAKSLEEGPLSLDTISGFTDEEVKEMMSATWERRIKGEENEGKDLPLPKI